MNYLTQILAFEQWEELNPLPDKAYRLWYKLMAIVNSQGWPDWQPVPLIKLKSELHTSSDQTIMNARNALVQLGRIEVRKGKHGKSADYHIVPFPEGNRGVPSGEGNGVISGGHSGVSGGGGSGAYIKQNKTKQNKNNTSGKSWTSHKKAERKFADDSVEMELALYLFEKIKQNNPEHKALTDSQKQKWADSIRLMIERDNRTPQKIRNMIDWCQADSFWKQNILSTAKLRKQYDAMRLKAKAEWERKGIPPSGSAKVADDPWFNRKKA